VEKHHVNPTHKHHARHAEKRRPAPVVHRPAPRPHRPAPPPHPRHAHHGCCNNDGWITLGAAAVGGLIGGIIGACN
jgi:hypothetical protein